MKNKFKLITVIISLFLVSIAAHHVDAANKKNVETTITILSNQSRSSSYGKFVGTYSFTYTKDEKRFDNNPIIVLNDGRCIIPYMTLGGKISPTFIGNIKPISNTAFRIIGTRKEFFWDMGWYNTIDGRVSVWTPHGLYISDVVFDIAKGRVYKSVEDYNNRDISEAYYTPFTHSKSTSY